MPFGQPFWQKKNISQNGDSVKQPARHPILLRLLTGDGQADIPSFSFVSDKQTGLYRISDGRIGISASNGVKSSGKIIAPNGSASSPSLVFSGNEGLGFYYNNTSIGISYNGTRQCTLGSEIHANFYASYGGGYSCYVRGHVTDTANVVAVRVSNALTFSGSDRYLMGFYPDMYCAQSPLLLINSEGKLKFSSSNQATGTGAPSLGSNCPATTLTAPYTWFKFLASDGSVVYVPAWR